MQIAQQILLPEILKTYPEVIGIMFWGSRAGSDFYNQSDFDFRCVLPEENERFRITKKYQDYYLECFFNSKSREYQYLEENDIPTFKMYHEGVILYDPESALKEVKNKVTRFEIKPKSADKQELAMVQYTLATLKEKISNPNLDYDKILFLEKMFQDIFKNYQLLRPEAKVKHLKIDSTVKNLDPELYTLFILFASKIDFTKKKNTLLKMITYLQNTFNLKDTMEFDSRVL